MSERRRLNFYHDRGHGWLEVPISLIAALGIGADISTYSFRACTVAYLEEDMDYTVFAKAACADAGLALTRENFQTLFDVRETFVGDHDARNPRHFAHWGA